MSDAVVVEEVDETNWDLEGVMTAAEAKGRGLRRELREL